MKRMIALVLAMALLAELGLTGLQSAAAAPDLDIWKAAASGDIEAIKLHLEAGTDVDAKEPPGGTKVGRWAASLKGSAGASTAPVQLLQTCTYD